MENTPNNNLISAVCDAISTGYNFGGWTDPMDERVLGPNEAKASNKVKQKKFKIIQQQEVERDRARQDARMRIARGQKLDDRITVKPFRNR